MLDTSNRKRRAPGSKSNVDIGRRAVLSVINAQRLAKSGTDLACAYITLGIGVEAIQISKRSSSGSRPPQLDR